MDTKIVKIQALPKLKRKTKVAAYARVSSGKDAMLHSLSYQVSYYNNIIQARDDWEFVGVYSDEAVSGTKANRVNFNRMVDDCRAHKIDLILTKSISRFARNSVILLETVRELKQLNVDVFFEEQNIHTMSGEGELMISILAGFAQEEAKSVSDNMKWRVKKNFEEGRLWGCTFLGYRFKDGKLVIEPEEAKTVRLIFKLYLEGYGSTSIAKKLTELQRITRFNNKKWRRSSIPFIITNNIYTGDLLLQKTYRKDYLDKHSYNNKGILPQYYVENNHEPIISKSTFEAVQMEIKKRKKKYENQHINKEENLFKGLIKCENCGCNYLRKMNHNKFVWACSTHSSLGREACLSMGVPESAIIKGLKVIFSIDKVDKMFINKNIKSIVVQPDRLLVYELIKGEKKIFKWTYESRALSWTDEMKEEARKRTKELKEVKTCQR